MRPDCWVTSGDGVRLAVYVDGDPAAQAVVLAVHGYPDRAAVWDGLVADLARDHLVVRHDVRGAGQSDHPRGRAAYRLERMAADVSAVLTAIVPNRPVHLVGHDLGSVQGWYLVSQPEFAGRFASFTSISGPNLAYFGPWLTARVRGRRVGPVLGQLWHSSYIPFFKLPLLPELAWRTGLLDLLLRRSYGAERPERQDATTGLQFYRANLMTRASGPARRVEVPVQVIAPVHDSFVGTALQLESPVPFVPELLTHTMDAGHWVPRSHPGELAAAIRGFAAAADGRADGGVAPREQPAGGTE